ncbi:hypothetical protein D3C81_1573720 [compost metagenome]
MASIRLLGLSLQFGCRLPLIFQLGLQGGLLCTEHCDGFYMTIVDLLGLDKLLRQRLKLSRQLVTLFLKRTHAFIQGCIVELIFCLKLRHLLKLAFQCIVLSLQCGYLCRLVPLAFQRGL